MLCLPRRPRAYPASCPLCSTTAQMLKISARTGAHLPFPTCAHAHVTMHLLTLILLCAAVLRLRLRCPASRNPKLTLCQPRYKTLCAASSDLCSARGRAAAAASPAARHQHPEPVRNGGSQRSGRQRRALAPRRWPVVHHVAHIRDPSTRHVTTRRRSALKPSYGPPPPLLQPRVANNACQAAQEVPRL